MHPLLTPNRSDNRYSTKAQTGSPVPTDPPSLSGLHCQGEEAQESRQSERGCTPPPVNNQDPINMERRTDSGGPPLKQQRLSAPGVGQGSVPSPSVSVSSSGNGNGRGCPELVVVKEPPSHVVSDEWFEIEIGMDVFETQGKQVEDEVVELVADLVVYNSASQLTEPVSSGGAIRLSVGGSSTIKVPVIYPRGTIGTDTNAPKWKQVKPPRGTTKAMLRIQSPVGADKPIQYCVRIARKEVNGDNLFAALSPVLTRPVVVVSARLKVEASGWEPVFFKDEGGREKCMSVEVSLVDKNGEVIRGRRIPLKFTLLYDNDKSLRVMRQEILKVFGPPRQYVNPQTGSMTAQFRIEDVSKNHQGMGFKVEFSPDTSKATADIAPAFSPQVSIRSKRNKRQRPSQSGHGRSSSHGSESFQQSLGTASVPTYQSQQPLSRDAMGQQLSLRQQPLLSGAADFMALRAAMRGVIRWTEEVVNGLYPLKWEIIGYAQFPDGSPDYSRPYHSMPNPNECISKVLSMYSDETREHLRTLLETVESSTRPKTSRPTEGDASAPGAAISNEVMQPHTFPYGPQNSGPYPPFFPGPSQPELEQEGASPNRHWPGQGHTPFGYPTHNHGYPPQHGNGYPAQVPHPSRQPQMHQGQVPSAAVLPRAPPVKEAAHKEATKEDVEYIFAKQYKSLRTGEKIGFPCYDRSKAVIGFIRESSMKVGVGQFTPISNHRSEFGPTEIEHARRILEDAIAQKSPALHAKEVWGTVESLIDHALVYEWSKDAGNDGV